MKRFVIITFLSLGLSAGQVWANHENHSVFKKENIGGAAGATLGAFLGSKIGEGKERLATTAAGAVGGYILGKKATQYYSDHHRRGSLRYQQHRSGYRKPLRYTPEIYHINDIFYAKTTSNVRGGPSTRFVIVDRLYRHQPVKVIGRVINRNWFLVRTHYGHGYVYAPLLRPFHGHNYSSHTRY